MTRKQEQSDEACGMSQAPDTQHACNAVHQFPVIKTNESVKGLNKYLVYFVHRHLEYRLAEVEALATREPSTGLAWGRPYGGLTESPFWYLHLPSDAHVVRIAEQCLLAKVAVVCRSPGLGMLLLM